MMLKITSLSLSVIYLLLFQAESIFADNVLTVLRHRPAVDAALKAFARQLVLQSACTTDPWLQ